MMSIILIVHYMANDTGAGPFDNEDMNDSYASLSYYCRQLGMSVYVGTQEWYEDGISAYGWEHDGKGWEKKEAVRPKLMFLKIRPSGMKPFHESAQMHSIRIVNNPMLDELLNDKMQTYNLYPELSPLSVIARKEGMIKGINAIRKATLHDDLDANEIFMKPLSLSGGEGIIVIKEYPDTDSLDDEEFILQPRIVTSKRFVSFDVIGNYDCRVIMHNSEIIQCYLRISESDITNAALGGKTLYIPLQQVPIEIEDTIRMIDRKIEEYGPRIYSIDFVIGKSGRFWLIEMNAQPGLSWTKKNDQKIREARILHQHYALLFKESLV
jgi:glutathione synthase/RimK-type ligase-like ATP-grasp enzyme